MATIQKRGKSYSIRVSCGYDTARRQIVRSMTWRPEDAMTEAQAAREVRRQAALFEERCRMGRVLTGSVRFADFAGLWMRDYAARQVRPTTCARYRSMLPRICGAIGHLRLDRIQPHHLLAFYAALAAPGVRADGRRHFRGDLRAELDARGLTRPALAAQAGVSLSVVSSVIAGRNVSAQSAQRLAAWFGKPVDALFAPAGRDTGLAPKTILHHHRLISVILATAVKWQVLFSNPCDRVQPPRAAHIEAKYLDEAQAARLLAALTEADIQHRTIIIILLYTGMRRGELCGLTWDDVDFGASVIHIRRSSLYLAGRGIFVDSTKNPSSRRSIKVPQDAMDMLLRFRQWQEAEKRARGAAWQDSGYIFTATNGTPIHPDAVTSWFARFVHRHGLPDIPLHALRHTNATLLIAGGINLQTVAARLGHANVTTTGRIYAHAIQSADAAAAETLQDLLHPLGQKSGK